MNGPTCPYSSFRTRQPDETNKPPHFRSAPPPRLWPCVKRVQWFHLKLRLPIRFPCMFCILQRVTSIWTWFLRCIPSRGKPSISIARMAAIPWRHRSTLLFGLPNRYGQVLGKLIYFEATLFRVPVTFSHPCTARSFLVRNTTTTSFTGIINFDPYLFIIYGTGWPRCRIERAVQLDRIVAP